MKQLLLLSSFLLLLGSCQKEIDDLSSPSSNNSSSNTCKLATSYVYNLVGAVSDSAVFTYKGDRIVKVSENSAFDSLLLQYTGANITKRVYYGSGTVGSYDNLFYNADGTVRAIEQFADISFFGGGMERTDSALFTYSSGKLIKRTRYTTGLFGQGLVKAEENLFQYTGNNITKSIRLDYGLTGGTTPSMDTTVIEYDVQPNYLQKQGFPFMLADPAYINTNLIVDYYVLFMSENNPVKVYDSQFPAEAQTITYARDAKGNVLEIRSGGDLLAGYKYKCP